MGVLPSILPSVLPLRLCKNRVFRPFLATVRSYTETNDQTTCFESSHPSVRPSVSPYMSHDQYTQRHSPDASLPDRACLYSFAICNFVILYFHTHVRIFVAQR